MNNKFVSLRTKILVGFTLTFTFFFGGVSFWFYRFTTEKTFQRWKDDLERVAIITAKHIDVEELMGLYREGKPNNKGTSDDPRYYNQLRWLQERHEINPQIFLYTFVKDNSQKKYSKEEGQIIYLVDVWTNINPRKSAKFLESAMATQYHLNTLTEGTIEFRDFYRDKWGDWITVYVPILDKSGNIVAGIGADMEAGEIEKIQKEIKKQFLTFFSLSCPILIIFIYGLSTLLTRRFRAIQQYAEAVGDGNYQPDIVLSDDLFTSYFPDERLTLSHVLITMAKKIKQREELLNGIFKQVSVGVSICSSDLNLQMVNQKLCRILGYSEKELLEKNCLDFTHKEDLEKTQKFFYEMIRYNIIPPLPLERRCIHKKGHIRWFETGITPIRDNYNHLKYFILVTQDITLRREAENKLMEAANRDFLTKLPNRAYFMEFLDNLLLKTQQDPNYLFALLLIDIDNFKTINDSLGHLVGDKFLINIASILGECITKKDLVARLGGDEFAILLTSINSIEDAVTIAKKVQTQINFPVSIYNEQFFNQVSASIGIVLNKNVEANTFYLTASDLFRDADIAMYQVKNKGKKNYQIFGQEMYDDFINRLKLENELEKAIQDNNLTLFYQPIFDLNTGKLCAFESLVRWYHPVFGFLTPNKFLPIAEQTGLIVDLGNWALKTACYQLYHWQKEKILPQDIVINVNVAGKQFEGGNLLINIVNIFKEINLSPHNLRLEVTENVIVHNISYITNILKQIQSLGVKVAIDDFGTGYSSLARLRNFPVNQIKIDKAFVAPLTKHPKNIKFLQGIITLCHNLDLTVVCEGIETENQQEILSELSCNYGQGFLYAKPMNVNNVESWVKNRLK